MQTNNKTTNKTNENVTTFTDLLIEYEFQSALRSPKTEKDFTQALLNLATAVTYSVLKKCIDTSQNQTLVQIKRDITRDAKLLSNIDYAVNNAYEYKYNKEGERVVTIKDKELHKALEKLCSESLGEGIDLVNDAVIAIMQETEKASKRVLYTLYDQNDKEIYNGYERPQNIPESVTDSTYLDNDYYIEITPMNNHIQWLEMPYTIRRLRRKVWIKNEDSKSGWETVQTTPIQEIYKAVRRSVEQSRAVQTNAKNGYTYLSEIAKDEESGTEETIYRRMPKYADIGGAVCDFNGKETAYTTDEQTIKDIDKLVASLNLSKQQAEILKLRMSGYGYKAIATYFGVKGANIQTQLKRIQEKAVAIGLTPCTK